jgi:hypothetical protein
METGAHDGFLRIVVTAQSPRSRNRSMTPIAL